MDEKKFETLSEQQQKKFLFKENIRLNELSQSLEEDRQLIDIPVSYTHLTLPTN